MAGKGMALPEDRSSMRRRSGTLDVRRALCQARSSLHPGRGSLAAGPVIAPGPGLADAVRHTVMRSTIPRARDTCISPASRVSRSQMTTIFWWSVITSSGIRCVRALVGRAEDWPYGSLWRWIQKADHDPTLLSPWPVARTSNWIERGWNIAAVPFSSRFLSYLRRRRRRAILDAPQRGELAG